MTTFSFADRYAQAGLAPGADIITARRASFTRIAQTVQDDRLPDLAGTYYGAAGIDLSWFRDEFAKEDASFSLINNQRETQVLSAIILGAVVDQQRPAAILAVVAGSVAGRRHPPECAWLVTEAALQLGRLAISERHPVKVQTRIKSTIQPKLGDEIAAITGNDWAALLAGMAKVRNESQSSMQTLATGATAALASLDHQVRTLREETQMLWWLHGGHSRSLERAFSTLAPTQAAFVGALDLAALTTVSSVGPIAAPALLERVLSLAARSKTQAAKKGLAAAVDSLDRGDLERLPLQSDGPPPTLAPITSALHLARTIGIGAWSQQFEERTGLDSLTEFEPLELAVQLYREQLLGRLL